MAKFYGSIGYGITEETKPGKWTTSITERMYCGELIRNIRNLHLSADHLNDDIDISNQISIIADPYAYENFHLMKYIEFMGTKWKIKSVEVNYPRLILTVGGVYNGQ